MDNNNIQDNNNKQNEQSYQSQSQNNIMTEITENSEQTEEEDLIFQKQQEITQKYRDQTKVKVVFLTGIFSVGLMYYNINFNGLLKDEIMEHTGTQGEENKYQLFQTLSFGPVIPFILFGGVLLDYIGIASGMTIYLFIMCIGSWVISLGGGLNQFWVLIAGKIIFNLGLQMGSSAESSLLAKWYNGGKLSIYNGAYLAIAKLGQLLASLFYPRLYNVTNTLFFPMAIGALICTLCFIIASLAPYMDYLADKQKKKISNTIIKKKGENNNFKITDIKKFNSLFWLVIGNFVLNYSLYFPFISNIKTILKDKFAFSSENSGDLQSIIYIIGFSSPIAGFLIKKIGKNFEILMFSIICCLSSFLYMLLITPCQETCFDKLIPFAVLQGIYLTLFPVVIIPAIAMASPKELLGSAYGFAYSLKNIGESLIPVILIGPVLENYPINTVIICFTVMSIIAFFVALILWYVHRKEAQKNKQNKRSLIISEINDNNSLNNNTGIDDQNQLLLENK